MFEVQTLVLHPYTGVVESESVKVVAESRRMILEDNNLVGEC